MAFLGQFMASLVAILALAWLARRLGLGRDVRIRDTRHAQHLADDAANGFEAKDIAIDRSGEAALLRDAQGRIMLVKLHGAQFAGRLLGPGSNAAMLGSSGTKTLEIDTGELLFGKVMLDVDDPDRWVLAVNSAKVAAHA